MPRYVSLFSYTSEAAANMVRTPADRAEATAMAIANAGGQMELFYWMLGDYDGIVVFEMPDEASVVAYSLAVASSGRVAEHKTFQLVDAFAAGQAMVMAPDVIRQYRPPGAPTDWREGYDAVRA